MKRNRSGVEDRWTKTVRNPDNTTGKAPSKLHGKGSRWRARYVDAQGREHSKAFGRKVDAQAWITQETSDHVTGTWTDPKLSVITFGVIAERWFKTKATRAPKTVAGYRNLLDTLVLPRWKDVPLREIGFEDMQEWVTGLSVDGSTKKIGRGLSASRVIQAHQVVGQVLRYSIRAKHLAVNPVEDLELPTKVEVEQRYLTHEQLHRLAVASGRFRTLVLVLGYCGVRLGEASALRVADVDAEARRIDVKRSATYVTGQGMVEGTTKNKTSRTVPVPRFLAPLLKTEIRRPRRRRARLSAASRRLPRRGGVAVAFRPGRAGDYRAGAQTAWAAPHLRQHGDQGRGQYQGRASPTRAQDGGADTGPLRPPVRGRPGRGRGRLRRGCENSCVRSVYDPGCRAGAAELKQSSTCKFWCPR